MFGYESDYRSMPGLVHTEKSHRLPLCRKAFNRHSKSRIDFADQPIRIEDSDHAEKS